MASTPSGIPTKDITQIYDLPGSEYKTVEQVAEAYGFKLLLKEKPLGQGGYAKVIRATRLDNDTTVAVKIMDISGKGARKLKMDAKNELFVLEKTAHPHIVRIYTHFIINMIHEQKNSVYIFMRLAENGSLSEFLRKAKQGFHEPMVRLLFAQIVSAVDHMHKKGIAHRDLKLGNVLLDEDLNAKVADFGLSRVSFRRKTGNIMSTEFKGTVTYMGPEILRVKLEKDIDNRQKTDIEGTEETSEQPIAYNTFYADVWALGVILFTVVNRKFMFDVDKKIDQKITKEDYLAMYNQQKNFNPDQVIEWSRYWKKRSPHYEDLVKQMFVFDPEKRIDMTKMCQHPWIKDEIDKINERIYEKKQKASPNAIPDSSTVATT